MTGPQALAPVQALQTAELGQTAQTALPPTTDQAAPEVVEPPIDPADSVPEGDLDDFAPLASDLPPDRFSNRELSWLAFNSRVLALAEDEHQPLLERLKYLAIFASNLDEFYMVRVAGLKRRADMGLQVQSADGLSPREVLATLAQRSRELAHRHALQFRDVLLPRLADEGIHIRRWDALDEDEKARLADYFRTKVFPVLTPLAVDPAHPFPYISGLSLNLAVLVRDVASSIERFARVKVPNNVPRFVVVSQTAVESEFLPLEDLIAAHLPMLFPGMQVVEHHLFRVTRNADFEVEEDRDEDLLQALERELVRRRFGPAVRLEVTDDIDDDVLDLLVNEIDVSREDVQRVPGLLDLSALWQVYNVDRPHLKDRPFVPATHPRFAEGEVPKSVFATLRDGDVLVHHPYESFATSVQRFVEQAAADPHVLAIKQTLYRTSGDSPIVDALIDAAEAGKQVVALVEIKARFDEQANIKWARALERAGCHVVYGVVGLKTHCKTALVVRQEGNQIRRYAHIGTGNYNPKTARLYEDLGLFTADEAICADLTDLFNVLTGYSRQTEYRSLLVAPQGIRAGLIDRIEKEIEYARAGRPAHIQFKTNHLVDEQTIDALYRASQAGVQVQLLVRTFCTIRPGVPGLSDNITVRSILGRFLEHSRIYYFGGDGSPQYWIGSADLMHRNLDRRVEVLCGVSDPDARQHMRNLLTTAFAPEVIAWDLQRDGEWVRTGARAHIDLQELLMKRLADRGE
ncbi:MAG TPA: RNA degradosome polyphosphate kinase [Jatrophihabitantaceae bacterium]|jgi:polyphosphate kinase|nr:RNA degradosome polyphosphate kinase [Jatrophihabitantaceae bacterium]